MEYKWRGRITNVKDNFLCITRNMSDTKLSYFTQRNIRFLYVSIKNITILYHIYCKLYFKVYLNFVDSPIDFWNRQI